MPNKYDVLIKNTTIVDGTGKPAFEGNVAVQGEKIVAVGETAGDATRVIDGSGLITCPGFVDPHNHADHFILMHPPADNLVQQGITTFVGGNCGGSPAPIKDPTQLKERMQMVGFDLEVDWRTFGEWLSKIEGVGISPNYVPLVGHNTIRSAVMGEDFKRTATSGEIEEMMGYVDESMRSGAFGLSTFFDPSPGEYASREEIVELLKVVGQYGGLYVPHTRHIQSQWPSDDAEEFGYGIYHGPPEDVWVGRYRGYLEAIEISQQTGVPLHIAHMSNAYNIPQPHPEYLDAAAAQATVAIIDDALAEGVDVTFDTITCSSSIAGERLLISDFLQSRNIALEWLNEYSKEGLVQQLQIAEFREKLHGVYQAGRLKLGMIHTKADPYWMDCFKIVRCANTAYEGKTIREIATSRNADALDVLLDILVEDPDATWIQFLDRRMLSKAIPVFLSHAAGMPSTDIIALPAKLPRDVRSAAYGVPPIMYGLYPHYFGTYVREEGALSLEEAVRKATSAPAKRFGLEDRGVLSPGAYADIVLFDLDTIKMTGTFKEPDRTPEGIEHVLINGQIVYEEKAHTGARPGKVLRHGQRQE